ncbi:MAG: hypothetical protein B0D92_08085 [Spirochaeta sp. LUC14_002_19_P3]|nr:MAG: hypothetical protein B0D92_08085 [Spirochaeta sp. LUC14_002_19_P3]
MQKYAFIAGILFISVLSACKTSPPKPVMSEPIVYQVADLTVTLSYLGEEELKSLYGRNDVREYVNPYYKYPGMITKQRLLVFNFEASTQENQIEFKLNDISLRIRNKGGDAKSQSYLNNIWSHYEQADLLNMEKIMRKTILPREFTVTPEKAVSGYLVFGENYPEDGGEGLITMFVSTPEGEEGKIEIPLQFSADGTVGEKQGEGIFSGNTETPNEKPYSANLEINMAIPLGK